MAVRLAAWAETWPWMSDGTVTRLLCVYRVCACVAFIFDMYGDGHGHARDTGRDDVVWPKESDCGGSTP